jgi:hypothetical protein
MRGSISRSPTSTRRTVRPALPTLDVLALTTWPRSLRRLGPDSEEQSITEDRRCCAKEAEKDDREEAEGA